jgi:hypothetical protein
MGLPIPMLANSPLKKRQCRGTPEGRQLADISRLRAHSGRCRCGSAEELPKKSFADNLS